MQLFIVSLNVNKTITYEVKLFLCLIQEYLHNKRTANLSLIEIAANNWLKLCVVNFGPHGHTERCLRRDNKEKHNHEKIM